MTQGRNPRPAEWVTQVAQHPKLIDKPHAPGQAALLRYACKMATGSGKTVVMALLLAWAFCNRGTKPGDARYPRRALVVCPNLTIRERLSVLNPATRATISSCSTWCPARCGRSWPRAGACEQLALFNPEAEDIRVGGVAVGRLGPETPESFARSRLGELWDDEPILVLNDEGHHAYRPAPVAEDDTHDRGREGRPRGSHGLGQWPGQDQRRLWHGLLMDLSATPFYIGGSGYPEGSPFPWIVSDFALVDAIESGITKIPRLPAADNTGRPTRSTSSCGNT